MINCTICNKECKTQRAVSTHMNRKHNLQYNLIRANKKNELMNKYKCKCPLCPEKYKSYNGVCKHLGRTHKIKSPQHKYMLYNKISDIPKCRCGCDADVTYDPGKNKFNDYILGHYTKATGFYTRSGLEKSAETRRRKFKSGELVQYNKGKTEAELYSPEIIVKRRAATSNPERNKKISVALIGRKKSIEEIARITADRKRYWANPKHREEQRDRQMAFIQNNGLEYTSKLEMHFEEILNILGIDYIKQFYVKEIKGLYDFKLKSLPILIEVDGDYWHCNPDLDKYKTPALPWHYENLKKDQIKNNWAAANNYTLLRFWENDIKNNRLQVIERLLAALKVS